jgi:hypothetical protein
MGDGNGRFFTEKFRFRRWAMGDGEWMSLAYFFFNAKFESSFSPDFSFLPHFQVGPSIDHCTSGTVCSIF